MAPAAGRGSGRPASLPAAVCHQPSYSVSFREGEAGPGDWDGWGCLTSVQVIAIMVKRRSCEDGGEDRGVVIQEVAEGAGLGAEEAGS